MLKIIGKLANGGWASMETVIWLLIKLIFFKLSACWEEKKHNIPAEGNVFEKNVLLFIDECLMWKEIVSERKQILIFKQIW